MTHPLTLHPDTIASAVTALIRNNVSGATVDVDGYRFKIDSGPLLARSLTADRPTVYRRVVTA